jgi:hypothetical protein
MVPAKRRHSGESRNPGFPVKTGTQSLRWFPTGVYPVLYTGRDNVWMPDQVRHDGRTEFINRFKIGIISD